MRAWLAVWILATTAAPVPADALREGRLRAHLEFLASDALNGRASASRDELLAALYAASQLRQAGVEPAGDDGGFLQRIEVGPEPMEATWNVVGRLTGSDPTAKREALLLSAHLDHLGVREGGEGDRVFNGADDDASGVAAVLELARALAEGARPRRTIYFALYGSEESGGFGSRRFLESPPLPLAAVVANLQFEMLGRPDPKLPPRTLWLAGYDRSDLGPALAAHGAPLQADPRPEQNFFERSDNIGLARRGVVAHSVSSFGLHSDYHQVSDEIARIDFAHLTETVGALVRPLTWLANDAFRPSWAPGQRPPPAR
jgi:Zn-dependent M28 family amino/carboxypeptidase